MPTVEEQIRLIADAAFADTRAVPMPIAPARRNRRVTTLVAAAALCAVLAGGLVVVAQRGDDEPVAPSDSTVGSAVATDGPVPTAPPTVSTPTTAPTPIDPGVADDATEPDLDEPRPYARAVEDTTGFTIEELELAVMRAEIDTIARCLTDAGWVVTPVDIEGLGYRPGLPLDAGETYGENALLLDERRILNDRLSLRRDSLFRESFITCIDAIGDELPGVRAVLGWPQSLPRTDAGDDPRFTDALEESGECLASLGSITPDERYTSIFERTQPQIPRLAGDADERADAIDQLIALDAEERVLDAKVDECVAPLGAVERTVVWEEEQRFLDDHPEALDRLRDLIPGAAELDAVRPDVAAQPTSAVAPGTGGAATLILPDHLSTWRFRSFENGAPAEPTFFLWPEGDDPFETAARVSFTVLPAADPALLDDIVGRPGDRPARTGESERRPIDESWGDSAGSPRFVAWESTFTDTTTGLTQQAVDGNAVTRNGVVIEFEARGIGLNTVIETILSLSIE